MNDAGIEMKLTPSSNAISKSKKNTPDSTSTPLKRILKWEYFLNPKTDKIFRYCRDLETDEKVSGTFSYVGELHQFEVKRLEVFKLGPNYGRKFTVSVTQNGEFIGNTMQFTGDDDDDEEYSESLSDTDDI